MSRFNRRRLGILLASGGIILCWTASGIAESLGVPLRLQIELISKLVNYDRNMQKRTEDRVRIAIVARDSDVESLQVATQAQNLLSSLPAIAGFPHNEWIVPFTNPSSLTALCQRDHVTIIYLMPGLQKDVESIRSALDGIDILSISAIPEYVQNGIVTGFDLVSGRPKLVINLNQARKQNVDFSADLLKLAIIYR